MHISNCGKRRILGARLCACLGSKSQMGDYCCGLLVKTLWCMTAADGEHVAEAGGLVLCFREAALQTAEAEKVKVIKAAEAEAEAKFLGGQVRNYCCGCLW